jgi:hypothetical protein
VRPPPYGFQLPAVAGKNSDGFADFHRPRYARSELPRT